MARASEAVGSSSGLAFVWERQFANTMKCGPVEIGQVMRGNCCPRIRKIMTILSVYSQNYLYLLFADRER